MNLVEVDELEKTVKTCLYSPYVQGEKALSLLIVAKPESGKTAILKKYSINKGIVYLTDATAYGLTRDILPKVVSGEVKHILIADLITPLSKSVKTRSSFIAFLNNLIEEGVAKITTYSTVWEKQVNCGLITAVTDEALRDGRHEWAKMGFLSRMILFSYSYSIEQVYKIFNELIQAKDVKLQSEKLNFPAKPKDIILPQKIAKELSAISMAVGREMNLYGFRFFLNSRAFIKALALMKGKKEVDKEDFEDFLKLTKYFNANFNVLR